MFMVVLLVGLPWIAQRAGLFYTVVGLFIFVQIYSLIHAKAIKNYYHIMLMSFFILVAALVMSPSASMGLVLFGYVICTAGCLLLIDHRNHMVNAAQISSERYSISNAATESRMLARVAVIPLFGLLLFVLLSFTAVIFVVMPLTVAGLPGSAVRVLV